MEQVAYLKQLPAIYIYAEDGQVFADSIHKLNNDQHQIENLLKNQISVIFTVIKTFNETVENMQINIKIFNEDMRKIQTALHKVNDRVALVQAELKFVETCEKLTESYLYLYLTMFNAYVYEPPHAMKSIMQY